MNRARLADPGETDDSELFYTLLRVDEREAFGKGVELNRDCIFFSTIWNHWRVSGGRSRMFLTKSSSNHEMFHRNCE